MKAVLLAGLLSALAITASLAQDPTIRDPHGDPVTGARRVQTDPPTRGQCVQCHPNHGDAVATDNFPLVLFAENTNELAYFEDTIARCHSRRPLNYPLNENDRLPETESDAGYFEANVGGQRQAGLDYRGRWPGRSVFSNPGTTAEGRLLSPHAYDPDMPRFGLSGEALCLNCHDPHGTPERDLLIEPYRGVGGHASTGPPQEYQLCFSCHGSTGPQGMDPENQFIADYYDPSLNGSSAGHQIRFDSDVALSWPSHLRSGDMLPCYDCHNPHGSSGNDGVQPNAFVLSDQRPGWSGLTDTLGNPEQSRRFCLGCHIPSDGIPGSQIVGGIGMNTIPNETPQHLSTGTMGCSECHGRDYSGPMAHNVHNPGSGESSTLPDFGEQWAP